MRPAVSDADLSCGTRPYYETKSAAKRDCKRLRKMPGRQHLEVYPCRHCDGFHIGNSRGHQNYLRPGGIYTTPRDNAA